MNLDMDCYVVRQAAIAYYFLFARVKGNSCN